MPRLRLVAPLLLLLLVGCAGQPGSSPTWTPGPGGGVDVGQPGDGPQNPGGDPGHGGPDDPGAGGVTPGSWAFGPVDLHLVFHAYETSTPVTQTWSGYICGDPFRESWTLTQVITSSGVSNTQTITRPAFRSDEQPVDYGGYLQIEAVPGAEPDEPGFRLFLGDSEPPQFTPQSQRIPVDPRWAPEVCS